MPGDTLTAFSWKKTAGVRWVQTEFQQQLSPLSAGRGGKRCPPPPRPPGRSLSPWSGGGRDTRGWEGGGGGSRWPGGFCPCGWRAERRGNGQKGRETGWRSFGDGELPHSARGGGSPRAEARSRTSGPGLEGAGSARLGKAFTISVSPF